MHGIMGMHSPLSVASCRGHRGAGLTCHKTTNINAPATWHAYKPQNKKRKQHGRCYLGRHKPHHCSQWGGVPITASRGYRPNRDTLVPMVRVSLRLDSWSTHQQGITHLEQPPSDSTVEAHGCRTQGGAAPWPRTTRLIAHYRMKKERTLRSAAI